MMSHFKSMRFGAGSLAIISLIGVALAPASAQAGFFDDLFGGARPQPEPSYSYDAPPDGGLLTAPRDVHRPRKHVVQDDKPTLQKTTDIWHDKTLHEGDAVMMRDGLHVYIGSDGGKLKTQDLPRIDAVDMPKKERVMLVSMDVTRNDPLTSGAAPDTIASGRSAAVASAVVSGYKITDARGKSVRYVGP